MARKILLADDSVTAQNMGRKILADAGYEVITVNNGSAALKKIGEQKPDLIVLDVYMPGYSGLEVCQRLKEAGDTARIPILLTVGKLEPFKPEEAKRVRADAFIVKPFEASELLSALSKLEDKVVPRSESSKPGRFARATAALEESRYDKSMATEEDAGWKSRIVFPKKKEKAVEADADDPAIYNPVNKDLRTVVEHKPEEHPPAPKPEAEEGRVNLGALAPEGLPKDVTPEEIAALAAAAAQVKGKITEEKPSAPMQEMTVVAPVEETAPKAEIKAEIKEESKPEVKEEISAAEPLPTLEAVAPAEPVVTLAEPSKTEEAEEKKAEPEVARSPSEVMAAIAGLEQSAASGNGSSSTHGAPADEPVTMAVAAAAGSEQAPRWTAVAVALAPEEAALSLEQEMQKAYAAYAAAEGGHSAPAVQESVSAPVTSAPVSVVETPAVASTVETPAAVSELVPVAEIPAVAAPEAASPLAEIASAAKEAVSAAVTELASVAASYFSKEEPAVAEPAPSPVPEAPMVADSAPIVEAKAEEPAVAESPKVVEEQPRVVEEEPVAAKEAEPVAESQPAEQPEQKEEIAAPVADVPAAAAHNEVSESKTAAEEVPEEVQAPEPVSRKAGGIEEMAKKESELTATTAAAWASWRKIRETGSKTTDTTEAAKAAEGPSASKDEAAMAVAAGAESKPEEVAANLDADPEISSIVDSVLADMRPKIVEEIARKLGKKK